jgi:two-component system chemotaxis response regulator CheB
MWERKGAMYRILIVDDSLFMRNLLSRYIEEAGMKVVGTARTGLEAIEKTALLKPDVITMDIEMPDMDGISALTEIMAKYPTPVIMISSFTKEGASETVRALQAGAVDFITKPTGSALFDIYRIRRDLVKKIKAAYGAPVGRLRRLAGLEKKNAAFPRIVAVSMKPVTQIVAVGASTGGPQALTELLTGLPAHFHHPIVIVQHMPPKFTASLAERLNTVTHLNVVEVKDEQPIGNNGVYIAPGDFHLNVMETRKGYAASLHQRETGSRHRPSVNELFRSVSALQGIKRHFVLLTGMGDDGAEQMLLARQDGAAASTIAEAKDTCIVYGMPKAAVERGAAQYQLPLHEIGRKLVELTRV